METAEPEKDFYREEQSIYRALAAAGFAPGVIYDVGAAICGWSQAVSAIFPQAGFHLFEPLIDHLPEFQAGSNRVLSTHPAFILHRMALGVFNGRTRMASDRVGFGATTLLQEKRGVLTEVYEVPIHRVDTLVAGGKVPPPDLLKMDVQGAELDVLKGAGKLLERIKVIELEAWLKREYWGLTPLFHEVIEFLAGHEFRLIEIGGHFYDQQHELYALSGYFVHADLLQVIGPRLKAGPISQS
ncbi:MAG: FkbM family methyltransferase [Verrucomicrobia bacterium]|nr:FkbM family methyltransferase [Verrucomicrobiota bacterium]